MNTALALHAALNQVFVLWLYCYCCSCWVCQSFLSVTWQSLWKEMQHSRPSKISDYWHFRVSATTVNEKQFRKQCLLFTLQTTVGKQDVTAHHSYSHWKKALFSFASGLFFYCSCTFSVVLSKGRFRTTDRVCLLKISYAGNCWC